MSFSRPIQWYHSHVDPICLDNTFNYFANFYIIFLWIQVRGPGREWQPGHISECRPEARGLQDGGSGPLFLPGASSRVFGAKF